MINVCLLGTSGMMPLPNRYLTSLYVQCNGIGLLIDCGEGTQIALAKNEISPHDIDYIFLTHCHGDHTLGIPGLLYKMAACEKKTPLSIYCPDSTTVKCVKSLLETVWNLPFEFHVKEIKNEDAILAGDLEVSPFNVEHGIKCLGYSIKLNRLPEFSVDKAKDNNIPVKFWNRLQHGVIIDEDGFYFTPEMVRNKPRKGIKITYCTDSRPCENIVKNALDSDLFVCEAMYGDDEKREDAIDKKHMLMSEAATLAKEANVKELWTTHYSPSFKHPENYIDEIRKIFPFSNISLDGMKKELKYDD